MLISLAESYTVAFDVGGSCVNSRFLSGNQSADSVQAWPEMCGFFKYEPHSSRVSTPTTTQILEQSSRIAPVGDVTTVFATSPMILVLDLRDFLMKGNATSFRTQATAGTPAFDQDLCPGLLRECCYRAHGLAPRAHERRVERRLARDIQGRQETEEARSRTGK